MMPVDPVECGLVVMAYAISGIKNMSGCYRWLPALARHIAVSLGTTPVLGPTGPPVQCGSLHQLQLLPPCI